MCIIHDWDIWRVLRRDYYESQCGMLVFYTLQAKTCLICGMEKVKMDYTQPPIK